MTNTFAAQATTGKAAVLNYASAYPFNDAAFLDPSNNLGSFKFHSGLYYLGCNQVLTGTVDLKYQSAGWVPAGGTINAFLYTLAAHGLPYTPVILGYFTIGGVNVPINGTSIVTGTGTVGGATAWDVLNVYADATNIILYNGALYQGYLANSTVISYTLFVCNMGFDASANLVVPAYFSGLSASPTQFKAGYFDPQTYGYFYRDSLGPITLYKDRSLEVDVGSLPSSSSYYYLGTVQNINGRSVTSLKSNPAVDSATGQSYPGTSTTFSPNVEHVSRTAPGAAGLIVQPGLIQLGKGFSSTQNTLLISNYVPVSLAIPSNTSSGGVIYRTDVYDLGACHPNATVFLGMYRNNGQWFSIGGTNYSRLGLARMGPSASYTVNSTGSILPASGQTFYLSNAGGRIKCTVRTFFPRGSSVTIPGSTIDFRIFAGTFDY